MQHEEIPGLAKYLPDEWETADLVSKTVPPTKCTINKPKGFKEILKERNYYGRQN